MTGTPNAGGGSISVLKSTSGNLALGTLNLYSTMFTNNIARKGSVIYSQYTGGTTNTKNSVNIFNSRFKNNGNHADCNLSKLASINCNSKCRFFILYFTLLELLYLYLHQLIGRQVIGR